MHDINICAKYNLVVIDKSEGYTILCCREFPNKIYNQEFNSIEREFDYRRRELEDHTDGQKILGKENTIEMLEKEKQKAIIGYISSSSADKAIDIHFRIQQMLLKKDRQ
jgi:hypothetical protein